MSSGLLYVVTELDKAIDHWVVHRYPPFLVVLGPPGTGKTLTSQQVLGRHREFPHVWIPATRGASLLHFLGHWELRGGETHFVEGVLHKALQQKDTIILIDDAQCLAEDLQPLNGVGDITRCVSCPELGLTLKVAPGVRVVFIANPPSPSLPPWERVRWQIPEQIMSRARVINLDAGLAPDDEKAIALEVWADLELEAKGHPKAVLFGLLEVVQHIRAAAMLTYGPSIRDVVLACHLLSQGLPLGSVFLQAVAHKLSTKEEQVAAVEAFRAKFGFDPTETGSKLSEEAP